MCLKSLVQCNTIHRSQPLCCVLHTCTHIKGIWVVPSNCPTSQQCTVSWSPQHLWQEIPQWVTSNHFWSEEVVFVHKQPLERIIPLLWINLQITLHWKYESVIKTQHYSGVMRRFAYKMGTQLLKSLKWAHPRVISRLVGGEASGAR